MIVKTTMFTFCCDYTIIVIHYFDGTIVQFQLKTVLSISPGSGPATVSCLIPPLVGAKVRNIQILHKVVSKCHT